MKYFPLQHQELYIYNLQRSSCPLLYVNRNRSRMADWHRLHQTCQTAPLHPLICRWNPSVPWSSASAISSLHKDRTAIPLSRLQRCRHWHDDVEFFMMMDGQMTYDINGQSITCRPGKVSLSTADACTMDTQNKNVENSYDLLSLTAMIGFIQKNYPGKLLLKDISSSGNCCKTKCTSLFQRYLSVSPMQYLNKSNNYG